MKVKVNKYFFWIAFIGFLVYFQTLFFDFTYFDDQRLILADLPFLRNFSNIFAAFGRDVFAGVEQAYYRPLVTISFMIDANVGGTSAFIYHFTNVLLHILSSILLFIFLKKLDLKEELAFLLSLLFAIHPVLTSAVSWIPGRNDLLLTVFTLTSFIFLFDFLEKKDWKTFFLHNLFFLLAVFTKESAIFTPVLYALYLILKKENLFAAKKIYLYLSWAATLVIWYLARSMAFENPIIYTPMYIWESLYKNSPATLLYLGKVIIPLNLTVLPILPDSTLIYGFLSLILLVIALVFSKEKRYSPLIFGTLWFLIFLVPNFIRPNPEITPDFLEHRIYLPLVGLFIVFSEIDFVKKLNLKSEKVQAFIFILISCLFILTFFHSKNYKNRLIFWQKAVYDSPHSPLAHRNLGAMYYLEGNLERAEEEFIKSSELNSNEPMVHNNLGLIYMNTEKFIEAEEEFKKELKINPLYDDAYYNYGLLLYKLERFDEAQDMWVRALKINPNHYDSQAGLRVLKDEELSK